MKVRYPALRVALHSSVMILLVYITMQAINYIRDNLLLGLDDYSLLLPTVIGFVGSTVLPLCLLFGFLIFLLALPLQKASRTLDAGLTLSAEEAERTRKHLLAFSHYILAFNLIGFAAGYILSLGLQGRFGDLLRMEGIVIMTSNLSGGFVYARAQTALNNLVLARLRDRLGIHAIGRRKREARSSLRQALLTAALLYYAMSFMQYQMHDFSAAKTIETDLLAEISTGQIQPQDAADRYRALLAERYRRFSTRPDLATAAVTLPWERPLSLADLQEIVTVMLFLYIFAIVVGIQVAASFEQREQIDAVKQRLRDVVAGGGDLRLRLSLRSMDDIGELSEHINRLLDLFQGIVARIGSAADQTRHGADSIATVIGKSEKTFATAIAAILGLRGDLESQAAASRQLLSELELFQKNLDEVDNAIESQNSFVQETSAAMEEMRSNIESVVAITANSRQLAEDLAKQGETGGKSAAETAVAIQEIDDAARQVLAVLGSLNKIAASINLLAMNAAIEAAHAGSAGLGFAVVADEVRNLATTATSETKNIKGLIDAMSGRVHGGVERSRQTGTVLTSLVSGLDQAAALSSEIASAMKEQGAGTRQVAEAVNRVVETTRAISQRMVEQNQRMASMSSALKGDFARLQRLADNSKDQADNVHALEASFGAVSTESAKNLAAVENLTREIGRFQT
ncbi:MAG: hypothetical protein A2Y35_00710 [Spirochaetes bacterium GWE1_60_18]|nr:MAG: hypothetical protein A2Y35_00710 [Spirochaetes bacterium GWE1_60_18]